MIVLIKWYLMWFPVLDKSLEHRMLGLGKTGCNSFCFSLPKEKIENLPWVAGNKWSIFFGLKCSPPSANITHGVADRKNVQKHVECLLVHSFIITILVEIIIIHGCGYSVSCGTIWFVASRQMSVLSIGFNFLARISPVYRKSDAINDFCKVSAQI